jgi:hypothetical protein
LVVAPLLCGLALSGCAIAPRSAPAPAPAPGPTAFDKSLLSAVEQVDAVTRELRASNRVPPFGYYNGFPLPRTNMLPPLTGMPSRFSDGFAWDPSGGDAVLRTPVTVNYPSGPVDPLLSVLAKKVGYKFAREGDTSRINVSVVLPSGTLGQVLQMIDAQLPAGSRLVFRPDLSLLILYSDRG